MSKLGESVRKLARYEKLKERIRRAEEDVKQLKKASIPGKRGIAYKNERNGNVTNQSGTPGVTLPNNSGNLFGNNQDSEENGATADGSVDGESLFTNKPDIGEEPGTIELKDCESGERIDVNIATNGMEGENIFKPPSDWGQTNSNNPKDVLDSRWELGFYWGNGGNIITTDGYSDTKFNSLEHAAQVLVELPSYNQDPGTDCPSSSNTIITSVTIDSIIYTSDTSGGIIATANTYFCPNGITGSFQLHPNFSKLACGVAVDGSCGLSETPILTPEKTQWPEGTTHQLSWDGKKGGFFSSKFDPDIPNKWKRPTDSYDKGFGQLDLCTTDDTPVTMEAVEDGFVYYERDVGGQPDTTTKPIMKFDKTGKYVGTISEDRYNTMYD